MNPRFYKVMLGKGSSAADECRRDSFIGADYDVDEDLTNQLPDNWRKFNEKWLLKLLPLKKTKISAGAAAGQLWTVSKGILIGDIVLCPTGVPGEIVVGEVIGDYHFVKDGTLPHRRSVKWMSQTLQREQMSELLRGGLGYGSTVCTLDKYANEILNLTGGIPVKSPIISTDPDIDDPIGFVMEEHLESFLVKNWNKTDLGKKYDIHTEDGITVGRQYQTDTGPIDILAVSKDGKELLIIELKRGRASDKVVGQVQRYMGFATEFLAEENQSVRGAIIALEDDLKIRRALLVAPNIDFYRYSIDFKLEKN